MWRGKKEYEVVDVFTSTRFGGNPLAVVLDARGLDGALMQRVAAEFGFSDSRLCCRRPTRHTAQVQIFTPTSEVPFAGHPNVGTAYVLARRGGCGRPLGAEMRAGGRGHRRRAGAARAGRRGGRGDHRAARARAGPAGSGRAGGGLRLARPGRRVAGDPPPQIASVGLPFVIAELASRDALARARPDAARFAEAQAAIDIPITSLLMCVP